MFNEEKAEMVTDESLAALLASALRSLVGDHFGFLFVKHARPTDRMFWLGVVPARHSRTQWILAFGAQVASTPSIALSDASGRLAFTARFLCVPQNGSEVVVPHLHDCAHTFPLPTSHPGSMHGNPTFLADYPLFGGSPSPAGSSAGSELGMGVPSGSSGGSPQAACSDGVADDY